MQVLTSVQISWQPKVNTCNFGACTDIASWRHVPLASTDSFRYSQHFGKPGWLDETVRHIEFKQQKLGIALSKDLAYFLVRECAKQQELETGRHVQSLLLNSGLNTVASLVEHLIRLYIFSGSLFEANQAFNNVSKPTKYTWNIIIDAHCKIGEGNVSLQLCEKMQSEGIEPGSFTFLNILKTCTNLGIIEQVRCVHAMMVEGDLLSDIFMASTLIDMYAKCGSLEEAQKVFDALQNRDVVAWGVIIRGHALYGEGCFALECYDRMQIEGIKPDKAIFLSILKACSNMNAIQQGRYAHHQIIEDSIQFDTILGNTLVDMYAKCGSLEESYAVFDRLPNQNVVSWNAILAGYAQHGECLAALTCFENMKKRGMNPSKVTFLSILKACSSAGAIELGRSVHEQIIDKGFHFDVTVGNTIIDMYAKCGNMEEALRTFRRLPSLTVVSWSVVIAGYAQLGEAGMAMQCFQYMECSGIRPNTIAFTSILVACTRAGLAEESIQFFKHMTEYHQMEPNVFHVTCMVDLLGRAQYFRDAENFIEVSAEDDICLYVTLLYACRIHGNVELGKRCFEKIIALDLYCASAYLLMANIYANVSMRKGLLGS